MKISILLVSTAAVLIAAEVRLGQPVDGLTVHEWGTFTSVAAEDGSSVAWDVLGGKDDLPHFVHNTGFHCFKNRMTATIRMETPVLYFYSPREMEARVRVDFPQGAITEWFPRAEALRGIRWQSLKIEPGSVPELPRESAPSRYYAARETDAAPVTIGGEHEKFLFYRGVGQFQAPLTARVSEDGKVLVASRGSDAVPMMILFENRGGQIGYRRVGAFAEPVEVERPRLDASFEQLRSELENDLVAQGLFPKEAQAMVETWRDSWFEEGSRLIYIVPPHVVDTVLPLAVEPAPVKTARVFVGRVELITPETIAAVRQAIGANDRSVVARYGRFLDPIFQRITFRTNAEAIAANRFRGSLPGGGDCR